MLLEGRTCLVSGVGPGLGREIALALAREGADVVLAARDPSRLEQVAAAVEQLERTALAVPTDITDPEQCEALVRAAMDRFGHVDVLVNNASAGHAGGTIESADFDTWRPSFEVNFFGSMNLTRAVIEPMRAQGGGSIVMIGSMIVRKPEQTPMCGYGSSKAALLLASRFLAHELGPQNIRVNSVVPGWMDGPAVKRVIDNQAAAEGVSPSQIRERIVSEIPLGFIPQERDCANAVVFLASDMARAITGQSLDVNGGEAFH